MVSDFEAHIYEDEYGIEISTNEEEKDHTISVNSMEKVKKIMDVCRDWLYQQQYYGELSDAKLQIQLEKARLEGAQKLNKLLWKVSIWSTIMLNLFWIFMYNNKG
jgi:hypothetical protein